MKKSQLPLIILDRDGVINYDSDDYIKTPDEWQAIPGSLDAICQLKHIGYTVVIVTNQSGVARGLYTLATLATIHQKLQNSLAECGCHVDAIFFCPHGPDDGCACRKPKPGMIKQALQKFNYAPENALLIGDSLRDIQAAHAAGCNNTILVKTGYGSDMLKQHRDAPELSASRIFPDLAHAVAALLNANGAVRS